MVSRHAWWIVRLVTNVYCFLLVRHPHVMEKLRTEIARTCAARSHPSRADLKKMPYLQNVLKESTSSSAIADRKEPYAPAQP